MLFGLANWVKRPLGAAINLSIALGLVLWQPAFAQSALWQQYHALGKQSLASGNCDLAERYLIGALQGAGNANVAASRSEVQDLLSDLKQLSTAYKAKNNFTQANYIGNWLALSQAAQAQAPPQQAGSTWQGSFPAQGIAISKSTSKSNDQSWSGQFPPYQNATPNNWGPSSTGGFDPSSSLDSDGHHREHDCRDRDREELERAIKFLEHSMNECANGINKIINSAK